MKISKKTISGIDSINKQSTEQQQQKINKQQQQENNKKQKTKKKTKKTLGQIFTRCDTSDFLFSYSLLFSYIDWSLTV